MVGSVTDASLFSLYQGQTALSLLTGSSDASSTDDSGILLADLEAKEGITDSSDGSSAAAGAAAPTAPWNSASGAPAVSDAVRKAVDGAPLIDPSSASLDAPAGTSASDYKNLFALWQGLNTLSDIAQTAAQQQTAASGSTAAAVADSTSPYSTSQLQQAFAAGWSQLQGFLAGDAFKGFNVTSGQVGTEETSTVPIAGDQTISSYSTGVITTGDVAAPIPGLQGPAQFTITLQDKYATTPKTLNIDLSNMGATPRTMDSVAAYINSQLRAAGAITSFSVAQMGTTAAQTVGGVTTPGQPQWGFTISGSADETVSFSAPSTAAAVYVSQATGGATSLAAGGDSTTTPTGEQLVKLDTRNDATGATPTGTLPGAVGDNLPQGGVFANALPEGVTDVKASTTGADGSLYLLADASGAVGGAPTPGAQGVALLKYDSAGQLVYSKVLSQGPDATGYSLAVAADGTVAVAGTNTTPPADITSQASTNAFLQVFAPDGSTAWTRSVPALGGTAAASGVAIGADGSVYLSGTTTGSVGDQIPHGSSDSFIQGFKADGTATFTQQFGSSGVNTSAGLAYDQATGSLYAAGLENGHAVVRSFQLNGTASPSATATRDLGVADSVVGVGVQNGQVAVAGNVSAASLNAGTVTQPFAGQGDAFVANIAASLTPAASDNVAYLGAAGATEKATGFAFAGGQGYVTGTLADDPHSVDAPNATEGFVTAVAAGTGAITYSARLAGANGQAAPSSIAVGTTGASALDLLGLPEGAINAAQSDLIVANTSIRAGDSFYVRTAPGGPQTPVTITAKDTLTTLADKLNNALGYAGTATVLTAGTGSKLEITSSGSSAYIELDGVSAFQDPTATGSSADVLGALGLPAGIIRTVKTVQNGLTDPSQLRNYGLDLPSALSIDTAAGAQAASNALASAMYTIQQAYQDLASPPTLASEAAAKAQGQAGTVPTYLTNEIANYQAGLDRLLGGGS
jgi:hypothetical protein